jgi:hypothetical protein
MFAHPDLPECIGVIELSFPGLTVFVCIEDEYDTLACTNVLPPTYSEYIVRLDAGFWDTLVGKDLTNAWLMTSDRGYPDAIQLRFRDLPNAGNYSVVQMYGEASRIVLTQITVVREWSFEHHK